MSGNMEQRTDFQWDILEEYLRKIDEPRRIYPNGKKIEVVFTIKALNMLLLRTEGPGDINEVTLPESKLSVPVIQPQKLMAVVRRRMLHLLRLHRDYGTDLKPYIEKASELGFTKASEHLKSGWNCSIQPPLAEGGEKATDIGMDGYCPACTIFGVALTSKEWSKISNTMSLGLKTRVHFDPAFAVSRKVQPETHNKVTEGIMSSTGGALFTEIHVLPGTTFVGRVVLHDLTKPELLTTLYSLITSEEIGGRAGIYGTIKIELLGMKGGFYSITSSLDLADEIAKNGKEMPSEVSFYLSNRLKELGFVPLSNQDIIKLVDPKNDKDTFTELWRSSIEFVRQLHDNIMMISGKYKGK
ncbi:MAG TPA: type I-D CRISPR-associated protein Cas7/Csc2 [Fervidicoccus fontis]|uniref:Type I-D CRISPR-associated protein Cas7/Csc2 n=2 Tax=Fervidicoccus fontis TaxID=683846 RepID=A0A7C2UUP0_9CREN|nr:type I-D CRISPR-associated protein Cas7/Csc2 [Fervidicoccus fontis]